jgi:hypothetical protein
MHNFAPGPFGEMVRFEYSVEALVSGRRVRGNSHGMKGKAEQLGSHSVHEDDVNVSE